MSNTSRVETLTRNWCVYILYNTNRTKVLLEVLMTLSGGINWSPVLAITGFHSDREATKFESNVRILAKKREFSEYASLYAGSCPAVVVKHSRQLEVLQNCPWSRIDRVVRHIKMDPVANESTITSNKNKVMPRSSALNDEEEEKKKATFVIRNSSPSLSSINGKKRKKHTGMISEFFKSTNFNTNNNHRLLEWFFDSEDEEEQEKELLLAFNPSYDLNKIVKNWKLIMDYDEFSNLKPINFTPKGSQATPLLWKFLEEYPTPYKAIKADVNELVNLLRPLGLQNIRAIRIIKFSCSYLLNPNFSTPKELFGMGQYAEDSWKLFCGEKDNAWKTIEPEDKILKMYVDWRREQHNN
ncbi:1126_t:CDS:2 [Entrophospora sp. SA101]|nr:1126_t:CDS:2 [Entrophospora sp. SA101]CAJ0822946.1 17052_t:CDS:2 [Entrophospora sp. SA101]